jgi:hypothetical protein
MSATFRVLASLAVTLSAIGCSDPTEPTRAHAPSAGLTGPFTFFPCVDTIFHASFSADSVSLSPGTPTVGSWTTNTSAGSVVVVSSSGWLLNKPVELRQTAGLPGGVDLFGRIECLLPPASGHAIVHFRSMVRSPTAKLGIVVLRDYHARALAGLAYRPAGVVTYNDIVVPGVSWTQNIPQYWQIEVDLTGHTTTLSLNYVPKLVNVPYADAAASNLWQINMELGYTSAQTFAWDDIQIVRYTW